MYVREHKEVQQPIDMRKVVHVVSYCSRPLPHGTKCVKFTVPGSG